APTPPSPQSRKPTRAHRLSQPIPAAIRRIDRIRGEFYTSVATLDVADSLALSALAERNDRLRPDSARNAVMKSEHRHELAENDLSKLLDKGRDRVEPHLNKVVLGLIAVAVVVVGGITIF